MEKIKSHDFFRNYERDYCRKITKEFNELIEFVVQYQIIGSNLERAMRRIITLTAADNQVLQDWG